MTSYRIISWYLHLSEQGLSQWSYISIAQAFCLIVGNVMTREVHVVIFSYSQHLLNILNPLSLQFYQRQFIFKFLCWNTVIKVNCHSPWQAITATKEITFLKSTPRSLLSSLQSAMFLDQFAYLYLTTLTVWGNLLSLQTCGCVDSRATHAQCFLRM